MFVDGEVLLCAFNDDFAPHSQYCKRNSCAGHTFSDAMFSFAGAKYVLTYCRSV